MKVTILGSGAALPDPRRMHSSILVSVDDDHHYLFDCGTGATHRIVEANVDPATVNTVFLTHLHHDHCADFPYFIIATWMCNRPDAPVVLGPPGTKQFVDDLFENGAFRIDIEARSQYPKRQENIAAVRPDVREMTTGPVFDDGVAQVTAVYGDHIPPDICECFALRLDAGGKSVVFSSDTKPVQAIEDLAQGADILIHDCTFPQAAIEFRKKASIGTWSHTSPADAGALAQRAGVKCLVANHFSHFDNPSPIVRRYLRSHFPEDLIGPDLLDTVVEEIRSEFDGRILLAHDLMRIDP